MITYRTFPPPPDLVSVVRSLWMYRHDGVNGSPYVYRSLADVGPEIVFHVRGDFREITDRGLERPQRALLHAPAQRYRRYVTTDNFTIVGVYLHPYAVPRVFGTTASAVANHTVDLQDLWGTVADELTERVFTSASVEQAHGHIVAMLRRMVRPLHDVQRDAVHAAILASMGKGAPRISTLARAVGKSERYLERQFPLVTGFSPKLFSRIVRFQQVLQHYGGADSSTHVALDHGFFDQAHFIRDFQSFSGFTPARYFAGGAEGSEYRDTQVFT